jgi:DNA-binding MarR family transcriptional regulator
MPLIEEQIASDATLPAQPLQGSSMYIVRRMRRAFLSICRCGDVIFSPYRLTTEQYALMRAVHRNPGIRQADVTNEIFAEPNTVTAMVTLLEKRGILRRKSCPSDGRVRLLSLTAHGQAVMQKLSSDWSPMRNVLQQCFSGEEGKQALNILDRVFTQMQRERETLLQKSNPEFRMRPDREAAIIETKVETKVAQLLPPVAPEKIKRAIKPTVRSPRRKKIQTETKQKAG